MDMNIMISLGASATVTVIATAIACAGLVRAGRARAAAQDAQARLALAENRLAGLEAAMNLSSVHIQGISDRLQQLAVLQQRVDAPASRQALREAIALTRNGAREEQIVRNCGIGEGEARLIQALHGRGAPETATH
jgi:hypothetical protein